MPIPSQRRNFIRRATIGMISLTLLVTLGAVAGRTQTVAPKAAADAPKPKEKNSSERLRPKVATLTASIEPATAKPGDTVRLRVTAKLEPDWHIYEYAKTQPADGPKVTQFDLFATAGLTPEGDWTPDGSPILKEEPAFNNMVLAFYEDKASWSIPLKLPADAKAGSRVLQCQVAYQICNAKSCLPPGRWTLPEVVLTVASAGSPAPAAVPPAPERPAAVVSAATVPASAPAAPRKVVSDVEQRATEGIIPLMITSALGGLLALVMPCVWPMVPITVNFFVKQGEAKKGASTTGLAVAYCLAIIGVFTAVGVLFSFFFSATALTNLANNAWLNFGVAALFFAFGLSLLGLFEIRLPAALLNASSRAESRGGLIGVVFMALTLTITSFTCTFPVVGGLVVMAAGGQFFYPIIGLATFATVLALPFFLLALSPGLLSKMPRGGDWMNTVKVVGGLIEIGAALKFLNTAEIAFVTPDRAWVNAPFVLTAWVILAAVCGFYLLGFFKTDHDYEDAKVGAVRMMLGASFLGIALFLAPALFGRPPQSPIWTRLVVGMLPPDATSLAVSSGGGGGAETSHEKKATSTDPKVAEREEKRFHGVWWGFSYEEALERAKAENKPVLIDFTGLNCANCRLMESGVLIKPDVVKALANFIPVQLYGPPSVPIGSISLAEREALAERNVLREDEMTKQITNPLYVVVSPSGDVLATAGFSEPDVFVKFLNDALDKSAASRKVAGY